MYDIFAFRYYPIPGLADIIASRLAAPRAPALTPIQALILLRGAHQLENHEPHFWRAVLLAVARAGCALEVRDVVQMLERCVAVQLEAPDAIDAVLGKLLQPGTAVDPAANSAGKPAVVSNGDILVDAKDIVGTFSSVETSFHSGVDSTVDSAVTSAVATPLVGSGD